MSKQRRSKSTDEQTEHVGLRVCVECRVKLPLDALHYDRDNQAEGGFRNICKACRAASRQRQENDEVDDKIQRLDRMTAAVLDIAAEPGSKVPHITELFEEMVNAFGGPQSVAHHMVGIFLAAPPGSSARVKVMDQLIRLGVKVSETGGARKPLDTMTDSELENLATEQMRRIARTPRIAESTRPLEGELLDINPSNMPPIKAHAS